MPYPIIKQPFLQGNFLAWGIGIGRGREERGCAAFSPGRAGHFMLIYAIQMCTIVYSSARDAHPEVL
jgi:hypothetical protein